MNGIVLFQSSLNNEHLGGKKKEIKFPSKTWQKAGKCILRGDFQKWPRTFVSGRVRRNRSNQRLQWTLPGCN